ncbi:thioredoxin-like protein [Dimargaris cristalligena]|uniref:Thioredoxin n=1 Tax=Dimargaris cristalligena TaxID=215637 RepID=A0A4P9ZQG6_9FUNG|nr:thioredoxin-like protein [Dimargaris cristalligena]|eukprot:RKP34640.1 thioredoxin-like protein [Dimargaris cristalligena]
MVAEINSVGEFEKVLADNTLVVVDFYAEWCGPCKMIAPYLATLAKDNDKVKFIKVNVDNHQAIVENYQIKGMPTFIFFKNGQVVETVVGASKPNVNSALTKLLAA